METEPPSNPQDLTAFVTDLLEQMRAASVREPASRRLRPARRRDAYPEEKRLANTPSPRRRQKTDPRNHRRQTRFESMSNQIVARIDEMGQRIDDLEKSIGELTDAAGIDPDVGEEKA